MGSVEKIDKMAPSKVRQELKRLGYEPNRVLRDQLKVALENAASGEEPKEPCNSSLRDVHPIREPPPTRSRVAQHLMNVAIEARVLESENMSKVNEIKVQHQESAKALLNLRKNEKDMDLDAMEEESFEVEQILDTRVVGRKVKRREFLIRWKGYLPDDDLWVKEIDLDLPISEYNMDPKMRRKLTDKQ